MLIDVFTLFPEHFDWFVRQRHVSNALADGNELRFHNYRDTTPLSAGQVDDSPYGGGRRHGDARGRRRRGARGRATAPIATASGRSRWRPPAACSTRRWPPSWREEPHLALLCGRYEGFDERVVEHLADESISIGRYVLAGGELPAMVIADAVLRKLPGALGDAESAVEESYSAALEGAPEYPHYTRPASYRGWEVPEVLLSGDHARVREWRLAQARQRAE